MAGHSHWKTIKYKKGAADAQKSRAFSKIARLISVAAREKGPDPSMNPKLRTAIEQAKEWNMPAEKIERAIKRGTGELEGERLEEISLEAYGPSGIAMVIEGITDSKNRALGEIKQILARYGGKLANEGSVKWMFERKGVVTVPAQTGKENKEEAELMAIEAGAEDIRWHNDVLEIYTDPGELDRVKKALEERGLIAESSSLGWVPKEYRQITDAERELFEKLIAALDENDAVQEIYANVQ